MKLLVVEDEALLRHHLYTRLGEQGHVVDAVPDAEEALYRVSEYHHDLAVIDLGLPGMSGLDLIRELRSQGKSFPILILTARGNWQDKVEGLAAGADDYVVKPFQFEELEADPHCPRQLAGQGRRPGRRGRRLRGQAVPVRGTG
ncbi:response regulator transcription factor, partial [Pseudomonas aeruginosa]|uniref:response regulator transcription factor n=1 Tax=Pseudomonas aeruginosa TaxID=287 RepID=UPI001FB652BA